MFLVYLVTTSLINPTCWVVLYFYQIISDQECLIVSSYLVKIGNGKVLPDQGERSYVSIKNNSFHEDFGKEINNLAFIDG